MHGADCRGVRAAIARETLGSEPEHLELECSGNIIKNVKSVTVPNSGGMHGLEAAATLGAVGGNPENALEVLESVDDAARARTAELLADLRSPTSRSPRTFQTSISA